MMSDDRVVATYSHMGQSRASGHDATATAAARAISTRLMTSAGERELSQTGGSLVYRNWILSQGLPKIPIIAPVKLEPSLQQCSSEGWHPMPHLAGRDTTAASEGTRKGRRPRECGYCGKLFWQKSDIDKHLRVHTGEKPYSCHLCPMTCAQKEGLKRHFTSARE
ncbi:hypothetical protein MTO96_025178 [Rhipicephalus appendiculatus]